MENSNKGNKKRKVNVLYTLRQFSRNLNVIKSQELFTDEEVETIEEIKKNAVKRYIEMEV